MRVPYPYYGFETDFTFKCSPGTHPTQISGSLKPQTDDDGTVVPGPIPGPIAGLKWACSDGTESGLLGAPADGYYLPFSVTSPDGFKEVAITVAEYTQTYTYMDYETGQSATYTYVFDSEIATLGFPATGETFGASDLRYQNAPYQTMATTTVLACPPSTLMTGMSGPLFPFSDTVELNGLGIYCREGA